MGHENATSTLYFVLSTKVLVSPLRTCKAFLKSSFSSFPKKRIIWETIEIIRIYFLVRHKTVKYYPFWSGFDIRNSLSESITLYCPKGPLKYIPCKAVQVLKEECSYDINKFKYSSHKKFSFVSKTIT